jgi:8-oxo-dGTP diphosphatase
MRKYCYDYPRPLVTVDCIVCKKTNTKPQILLIRRGNDPFQHCWALPGGFIEMDEELESAAQRELHEETGIDNINLTQFKAYGSVGRDPRGRTISVIFYSFINENQTHQIRAGDDAEDVKWYDVTSLPEMAFDHKKIVADFLNTFEKNEDLHNNK